MLVDRLIKNILSQLSKHIALITVAGSIFVFFSTYIYTYFFFKNINIPYNTIAMPIMFSAKTISFSIIFVMGYASTFALAFSEYAKSKNIYNEEFEKFYFRTRTIYLTLFISATIIILSTWALLNLCEIYIPSQILQLVLIELGLFAMVLYFFISYLMMSDDKTINRYRKHIENNKYIKRLVNIKNLGRLAFVLLVMILIFYISEIANDGYKNSKDIIAGKPGKYEVTLNMEDSNNYFHNKTLMLLMQYGDKFYLIDKCNYDPIPRDYEACVYVIPDHAIISATIREIPSPDGKSFIGNLSDSLTQYITTFEDVTLPGNRSRIPIISSMKRNL